MFIIFTLQLNFISTFKILKQKALPDVLNSAVGDFNFRHVMSKLGDVMYKFPFSLPPFYIAIIRCLGVLEGLALQVRPCSFAPRIAFLLNVSREHVVFFSQFLLVLIFFFL